MPRYVHTIPGTPDRHGINPFTREPMTFVGRPTLIKQAHVQQHGATVHTWWWVNDEQPLTLARVCEDEHEATTLMQRLVASWELGGFVKTPSEGPPTPPEAAKELTEGPSNPELERAIRDVRSDADDYSVYADWLQQNGNPRGELMSLQLALEDSPGDPKLLRAQQALFEHHAETFLPSVEGTPREPNTVGPGAMVWRRGFIDEARLADEYDSSDELVTAKISRLLAHPSARLLRKLVIGMVDLRGESYCDYAHVVQVVGLMGQSLRSLFIGDFEISEEVEISWTTLGDCSLLLALPMLESLILQGGGLALSPLPASALRHLEVRSGGIPQGAIQAIAQTTWPKLETLTLWLGSSDYGGNATVQDVTHLLFQTHLPQLRNLGLMNTELSNEVCRLLPTSPLAKQLEAIDLSMGTMTDEGAEILLRNRPAFPKLTRLDVSRNCLSPSSSAALANYCEHTSVEPQGSTTGVYVSVGE